MKNILAAAAILLFINSTVSKGDVLKWAWEDANGDGVWNYSVTNWNFAQANHWGNFAVSHNAYEGKTSLYFLYLNEDLAEGDSWTQAFGFVMIPTAASNKGMEPGTYSEYETGKDLRQYAFLEFYIKGSPGANQSAFHVWLRSPNGHGSVQVPLKKHVNISNNWQRVLIPLRDFLPAVSDPNRFQLFNVHSVGFYVNQDNNNVPFDFYVDNVSFVNGGTFMPDTRYWWKEDANQNGEYNYSTTAMQGGSSINVANKWGDVVTGFILTGPYGETRLSIIDLNFKHNGSGYAEANLTSALDNSGHEPQTAAERDTGKFIEASNTSLIFSAPEFADNGVKVKLVDQYGRSSKAVYIRDYRGDYGRYAFTYTIPTHVFAGNGFDYKAVKSVSFFVDKGTQAGESRLSLLSLYFQRN